MQKTAIVCVSNDLSTDQRVHKTCLTLQKCGYWVVEVGRLLPDSLPLQRPYFVLRKKLQFRSGPFFYAELNIRLFLYLLSAEVDLIFANDLDTLPAAFLAAKLRNKRLIYDTHEFYTETPELVHRPVTQAIWRTIENFAFPRLTDIITVNESIAKLYSDKFNKKIHVCRNIPLSVASTSHIKKEDLGISSDKKVILYQGALNVGRGLEWVLAAMPLIENAILLIIGDGDIRKKLQQQTKRLGVEDKVVFLGRIDSNKLAEYTPLADIGLCLLEEKGLSYYYSLPNRVFDYLNAGVPILATDFPEITKIVKTHKTGMLINHYEADYLAKVINEMLTVPLDTAHFKNISKELSWEKEEKVLVEVINKMPNL
jgi:glycosyltransferase involved in cell wall biosynthesis